MTTVCVYSMKILQVHVCRLRKPCVASSANPVLNPRTGTKGATGESWIIFEWNERIA